MISGEEPFQRSNAFSTAVLISISEPDNYLFPVKYVAESPYDQNLHYCEEQACKFLFLKERTADMFEYPFVKSGLPYLHGKHCLGPDSGEEVGEEGICAECIEEACPSFQVPYVNYYEQQGQNHHTNTAGVDNIGACPDGFVDGEILSP